MDIGEITRINEALNKASAAFKKFDMSAKAAVLSLTTWPRFRISLRRRGKRHVFFINLFD